MEGDGALVFDCFDVLSSLAASIQTGHFPNLRFLQVILILVSSFFSMDDLVYNLVLTTFSIVLEETFIVVLLLLKPLDYSFLRKSWRTRCQCYQRSTAFPFLADATTLHHLKTELPEYLAKAQDVSINMAPPEWWNRQSTYLTG